MIVAQAVYERKVGEIKEAKQLFGNNLVCVHDCLSDLSRQKMSTHAHVILAVRHSFICFD